MMTNTKRALAVLALLPALALGACGGSSDEDKIIDVIQDVAKDSATICDNASDKFLAQLGGSADECKEQARAYPDDSAETIDEDAITVEVDGETATADFTDNNGQAAARDVRQGRRRLEGRRHRDER